MPPLFSAIEIPSAIGDNLSLIQGGLQNARWIDHFALHITLRYFGEVDPDQAIDIDHALGAINLAPFTLNLHGVGSFGGKKPRSIWAGVAPCDHLSTLQNAHENACRTVGLKPEGRKFTPHVTLARLKNTPQAQVEAFKASHSLLLTQTFDVTRFVLFSSKSSHGGGPYSVEHIYPLTGPNPI